LRQVVTDAVRSSGNEFSFIATDCAIEFHEGLLSERRRQLILRFITRISGPIYIALFQPLHSSQNTIGRNVMMIGTQMGWSRVEGAHRRMG
jgi:hypothetical protein